MTCGSVLCQECELEESVLPGVSTKRPIHYLSLKLSKTQQRYSTLEKECFAIKYALEKFHPYIHNTKVIVVALTICHLNTC
jgi:hypothetical protein